MNDHTYRELLPLGEDDTSYRLLTTDYVSTGDFEGREILKVDTQGLVAVAPCAPPQPSGAAGHKSRR